MSLPPTPLPFNDASPCTACARLEVLRADVVDVLEHWGYEVHWKLLDTRPQGVPQSRPRFYLVALLRPVADRRLAFPVDLPTPDLRRFLDPPGAEAATPLSVWSASKR